MWMPRVFGASSNWNIVYTSAPASRAAAVGTRSSALWWPDGAHTIARTARNRAALLHRGIYCFLKRETAGLLESKRFTYFSVSNWLKSKKIKNGTWIAI
jgi:hypothetical protein